VSTRVPSLFTIGAREAGTPPLSPGPAKDMTLTVGRYMSRRSSSSGMIAGSSTGSVEADVISWSSIVGRRGWRAIYASNQWPVPGFWMPEISLPELRRCREGRDASPILTLHTKVNDQGGDIKCLVLDLTVVIINVSRDLLQLSDQTKNYSKSPGRASISSRFALMSTRGTRALTKGTRKVLPSFSIYRR
jgi:hypothetical protein